MKPGLENPPVFLPPSEYLPLTPMFFCASGGLATANADPWSSHTGGDSWPLGKLCSAVHTVLQPRPGDLETIQGKQHQTGNGQHS